MDTLTEIKEKLDELYKEYKQNKSQLSGEKTKEAAKLLFELTFSKPAAFSEVAFQLSRFSADVTNVYFDKITKDKNVSIDLLDEIIKEFLQIDKNTNKAQYYVQKFVFTITSIIKNCNEKASELTRLPQLVVFIAEFALKSEKSKNKFHTLINNTKGQIFMLDYAGIKKTSLSDIWRAANAVFPDMTKTEYESLIIEWGKKYGFVKESSIQTTHEDKKTPIKKDKSIKAQAITEDKEVSINKAAEASEKNISAAPVFDNETFSKELYCSLKRDMAKDKHDIIAAFTNIIAPIEKTFEAVQKEINKCHEIGAENVSLKERVKDLERDLSEQHSKLQNVSNSLITANTENEKLKEQINILENQNAELDKKLTDAYSINSRESSLEAERIRSSLQKAAIFLYEDWIEYEDSDVSEDNYKSLQAIIKKIFRSFERNGIDFKGNN